MVNSNDFSVLKKWNKKASYKRNIRVGTVVNTSRGIGIVTVRSKDKLWVAHRLDEEQLLWINNYIYNVDEVELSNEPIDKESNLYKGAWQHIMMEAVQANQSYEIEKHKSIVNEWSNWIIGKREKRTISTPFGSSDYVRFIGDGFDFEINVSKPFIPSGDKVLFAIGKDDGYITDMNGHGWIYRRKITDDDINYGLAKYAWFTI